MRNRDKTEQWWAERHRRSDTAVSDRGWGIRVVSTAEGGVCF